MEIVVVGTAVDVIIMQSVSSPNEWLALALDDQMCQAGIYHYFEEISRLAPGSDRQCSSIRIVMSLNPFPKPALHDTVKKRLMNVTASIGNRVFGHTLCEHKRLAESGATYASHHKMIPDKVVFVSAPRTISIVSPAYSSCPAGRSWV